MILLDRLVQYAVVGPVMRLHQAYDPAQLWLPFVAALLSTRPMSPPRGKPLSAQAVRQRLEHPYAMPDRRDPEARLYQHVKGVEQRELPFLEYRMVSDQEWPAIVEAGYPAWDLRDGQPSILRVASLDSDEVRTWLHDNCRGRVRYYGRSVRFERLADFAMARLRFA